MCVLFFLSSWLIMMDIDQGDRLKVMSSFVLWSGMCVRPFVSFLFDALMETARI